jgi:hypothetical protein
MTDQLAELNQASAAATMQVDRTTIRAWAKAGMPYTPPDERGKEGSYRHGVLLYWSMWRAMRDRLKLADLRPLQALAVARASVIEKASRTRDEEQFRDHFPALVRGYYPKEQIHEAIGFALAYLDSTLVPADANRV